MTANEAEEYIRSQVSYLSSRHLPTFQHKVEHHVIDKAIDIFLTGGIFESNIRSALRKSIK
jgi:hypothetical protein